MGAPTSDPIIQSINGTNYSTDTYILAELRLITLLLAYMTDFRGDTEIIDNLRSEILGAL